MSRNAAEDAIYLPFHTTTSSNTNPPHRSSSFRQNGRPRIVTPTESSLGNLNRWSRSTASSSHSHKRSNSFSLGNSKQEHKANESSPSGKLRKRRPSTSEEGSNHNSSRPPRFDANTLGLPPLNTLSHTQHSYPNGSSPLGTPFTPSPSTAQVLSALPKVVPDYFATWDEQPRDFSQRRHSRSRSASRDLSPTSVHVPTSSLSNLPDSRGHSRHRSQATKSSTGTNASRRSSKPPSQKAMLSKALQKANTAVLLDNAQNFEGAMQAYSEACELLQQVMARSSGDDDRRKLEAIRSTYTSRIVELTKIAPHLQAAGKALPARPSSDDYRFDAPLSPDDDDEAVIIETAQVTRIVNDQSYVPEYTSRQILPSQLPSRRESLNPAALGFGRKSPFKANNLRSYSKSPMREDVVETNVTLAPPIQNQYMPPALSPRRSRSPADRQPAASHERQQSLDFLEPHTHGVPQPKSHKRAPSNESMSWLDTIDESGGSAGSSIHSRTSSLGVRRKHLRAASGATEAEFDAALDAAVEAAYDDGYEPDELDTTRYDDDDEIVANVRRKVELAKERVRQTEREAAIQEALEQERNRLQRQLDEQQLRYDDYDGNESEEEERLLEEMTRGYVMDDFEFGLQSKSALPRESDSSGFSGRTWHSSIGSNLGTASTSLTTVAEVTPVPELPPLQSKTPPPSHPPPSQALPLPPVSLTQPRPLSGGVRSRRLSGQNAKILKIETSVVVVPKVLGQAPTQPPSMPPPKLPEDASGPKSVGVSAKTASQGLVSRFATNQTPKQAANSGASPDELMSPPTPSFTQSAHDEDSQAPRSGSPGRSLSRSGLRKNFSSSSLKNLKGRNLSVVGLEEQSDLSPMTPTSAQYMPRENVPAMPALPTPMVAAFKDKLGGVAAIGGLHLFNNDLSMPQSPGSPGAPTSTAPMPLEPCPQEFLLRPFWLMRAIYQTIAHPRGGYISNKLFIPRDVWVVKGVKLKGVEDKIAQCDFLTAALLKLAGVNTLDADAVLEEMQSLEATLEQVQAILTKKLGNEVGLQSGGFFGGAADVDNVNGPKSAGATGKSSTFSWRRLRTKNSNANLSSSVPSRSTGDVAKDGLNLATLPMTSTALAKVRTSKRDAGALQCTGPNAMYMNSLARLFDAAQTLDQIARQVDDPGLRHADKTQVGLELCTRHASEFFGFYICRFVLTDIGLLLDKFIKRGSEWVLI